MVPVAQTLYTKPNLVEVPTSKAGPNKAEQFVVRKSDTKVHTKVGCGFLLGFDFRNLPDFRIPRNSSFQKRETKVFFFDFRKRKSDTKVKS